MPEASVPPATGRALRAERGARAHRSGVMAEEAVLRHYQARGAALAARRWRSPFGEVDLILREGAAVVVVEVKRARSLGEAAHRLGPRQRQRLCAAAQAFCAGEPRGALTEMRLDLALVDGIGRVRVIPNAFGEDW